MAYPFAALLRVLPGKHLKHLVSALGGVFVAQWVFGPDWVHSLISSSVTYLICALAPRKLCPLIVFVWVMGYMTGAHVYRMYVSYLSGVFDFTGTQMVLTMKLTSFAYNLYDGTADRKNVFPAAPHEDKKKAKVYGDRSKFAVEGLPGPLEFFGYVYCFTCLLAGPAFEYNDYVRAIDGTAFVRPAAANKDKDNQHPSRTQEPSSVMPALSRLAVGVVCLAGHLVMGSKFPISNLYTPAWVAQHANHAVRFGFLYAALFAERLKYYFAWKVAEGASVLAGFGFQGFDKDGREVGWRGVENIEILGFETATNVQTLSRVWNKRTQGWLERYTYHRSGRSLVLTYFISAFWHGLYPGFFVFFMSIPLMTNIERLIKAKINPLVVPGFDGYNLATYPTGVVATVYWVVSWALTTVGMSYIVQTFPMSSWERCATALGSYHYVPYGVFVAAYVVLELLPSPKNTKKQ